MISMASGLTATLYALQAVIEMSIPVSSMGAVFKLVEKVGAERRAEEYAVDGSVTLQVAVPAGNANSLIELIGNATAGQVVAAVAD